MNQALKEVPCHHIDCPALVVLSVLASQKQPTESERRAHQQYALSMGWLP